MIKQIHPGEILKEEFLDILHISSYRLAKDIAVPVNRITEIINGKRNISTETALLLAKYFGMSDSFFIKLQSRYDELTAKKKLEQKLKNIHPVKYEISIIQNFPNLPH